MSWSTVEFLEPRLQFAAIQYGVAASGDPDVTGVLATSGPGLKDLGAHAVRLFTNTSFLSSDFDTTPSGKIYVRNPALIKSLTYARKYHDAGISVTLCVQLSIDRSMYDGSQLINADTGKVRKLTPAELRSPKVFRTWYDTFSRAQISKTDRTSVTKILDFWEIGNEPNNSSYWPVDATEHDGKVRIAQMFDSYVDHHLIPAYDVLSKLHEPVIGAGLGGGTFAYFDTLNNQPGARKHQYSNHCDYLNFHPYGILDNPVEALTPLSKVRDFTAAIYGDGTVKKPFVMTEYNLTNLGHAFPLDPNPNPSDAADQFAVANDLDAEHTAMLNAPHVRQRCTWIYYYRMGSLATKPRGALFYDPSDGQSSYTPLMPLYDLFKRWATGAPAAPAPTASTGVLNLGAKSSINAFTIQKDGRMLVLSDDGVRRYDTKGKLDKTYGVNGFAQLPLVGRAMALQGDGSLIVGGGQTDEKSQHLIVTRLSASGKVDDSFGTDGYFALADNSASQARSIALRAGKILVAGQTKGLANGALLRLNLTGQLDTTFAGGGLTVLKKSGPITDLAIVKGGAITALLRPYSLAPECSLARFTSNGELDATFSKDGITDPQPLVGDGMFVDASGSATLVGHALFAERQVTAHYTAAGNLDLSFGTAGIQKIGGKKFIRGEAIETPDGSRYLYGSIASSLTSDTKRIFVSKLTTDYQFDPSFGVQGVLTLTSKNLQDLAFAVATTGDSLIIAAGTFTQRGNGGMTEEMFSTSFARA